MQRGKYHEDRKAPRHEIDRPNSIAWVCHEEEGMSDREDSVSVTEDCGIETYL